MKKNSRSPKGMINETDTICGLINNGSVCNGALMRDERISLIEKSLDHRKYTCDKCKVSYKFT